MEKENGSFPDPFKPGDELKITLPEIQGGTVHHLKTPDRVDIESFLLAISVLYNRLILEVEGYDFSKDKDYRKRVPVTDKMNVIALVFNTAGEQIIKAAIERLDQKFKSGEN